MSYKCTSSYTIKYLQIIFTMNFIYGIILLHIYSMFKMMEGKKIKFGIKRKYFYF